MMILQELLKINKLKNWFRSYFNMRLARKARGRKRALPCEVGTDMFFVDPLGNEMPCNGSDQAMVMGNLHEQNFDTIWNSDRAEKVRQMVKNCDKQCWMIGSAAPAMKKRISVPLRWVVKNKIKVMVGKDKEICLTPIGD